MQLLLQAPASQAVPAALLALLAPPLARPLLVCLPLRLQLPRACLEACRLATWLLACLLLGPPLLAWLLVQQVLLSAWLLAPLPQLPLAWPPAQPLPTWLLVRPLLLPA